MHLFVMPEDWRHRLPVCLLRAFVHAAFSGKGGDADADPLDAMQGRRYGKARLACELHFLAIHGTRTVDQDMNGGVHTHSLTLAQEDLGVSCR